MEITYQEAKEKMEWLLTNKKSFTIIGLGGELISASKYIEQEIEKRGMKCRVYTRNRAATAAAFIWAVEGGIALAGIAAHNLLTFNPDYEIGRAIVDHKIYVEYKK